MEQQELMIVRAFSALLAKLYFSFFFRCKVYGRENLIVGSALIAANHASYFDPPLLGGALYPKKIYFLARDTLFSSRFARWWLKNCLSLPIKRGQENASIFKTVIKKIREGEKVALFPEGTRTHNGELLPFREGIGMIVQRSKAPVIPVFIAGTYDAWNCHMKRPKLFGKVAIVIGKPLDFSTIEGDKKEVQARISSEIMAAISQLQQEYKARLAL